MKRAIVLKKILQCVLLGVSLFLCCFSCKYFIYPLKVFGLQDLNCRQYIETKCFADDLSGRLVDLDQSASGYQDMPWKTIILTDMTYDGSMLKQGQPVAYRNLQQLIDNTSFFYFEIGSYGVTSLQMEDVVGKNSIYFQNNYYEIALNKREIQNAYRFVKMSRDDYVQLILNNAYLNNTSVNDIKSSSENDGSDITQIAETEFVVADERFSEDCYIGRDSEGRIFVYSPNEEMFYSEVYGWYSVPDTMFFLEDDVKDCQGVDLLNCRFTSLSVICNEIYGSDYTRQALDIKNAEYAERNMLYHVHTADPKYQRFGNVNDIQQILDCEYYICIRSIGNDQYTVEMTGFSNANLQDDDVTALMSNIQTIKPVDEMYIGIRSDYPYDDVFARSNQIFETYYFFMVPAAILAILMGILAVWLLIRLIRFSGRASKEDKTVYLCWVDKVPVELIVLAVLGSMIVLLLLLSNVIINVNFLDAYTGQVIGWYIVLFATLATGGLSLVRRLKNKSFFQNSFIHWGKVLCKKFISLIAHQKNLVARTVECLMMYLVVMGLGMFLMAIGILWEEVFVISLIGLGVMIALNVLVVILLIRQAKGEQLIREVTKALAEGDFQYQETAVKPLGTEQEIMDNIHHLSDGLQKAVEKSIYDERLKAELITNVSHDIKTPLTSIINYVDLIKREHINNEKVNHYIEVLDQKSQRLKQLTEDLVEVSKISTGNIELERAPIDFAELLRQSMGEFEDKFTERQLQMVDNINNHSYTILADGRRTYRVLENLFQNIYKYAMPNTRVYIDMWKEDEKVMLAIKNISKAPLNIDVKELMERFVRGDQSRTTEGSGLGLSIARDLVKLQDGDFELYLDGDLFKVSIMFPEWSGKEVLTVED